MPGYNLCGKAYLLGDNRSPLMSNLLSLRRLLCIAGFLSIIFLIPNKAEAQASFSSATHKNSLTQTTIDVTWSSAVNFVPNNPATTNIVGWTVKIAGTNVGVAVTSVVAAGTLTQITFNATVKNGVPFLLPGQTLQVAYAGGANLKTVAGGANVNTFTDQTSTNDYTFDCNEIEQTAGQGPFTTIDRCIPVVMNFYQFQYRMSLRYRNSSKFNLGQTFYKIDWGDLGATQNLSPYISDNSGVANAAFIDATGFNGLYPGIYLTLRPSHNYAATTTPAPDICSWNASCTPFVNLVATCTPLAESAVFANYDTDNANTGSLALPPFVAGSDQVCLGTNANMKYNDATLLNCRLAAPEAGIPNDIQRHVRIVYGSQNNPAPGNIPDVSVTLPAAFGGSTVQVTNNDATGTLIFPSGYFPTGAGGANLPDGNGAIRIPASVTAPSGTNFMATITTSNVNNQAVNQRFWVRMDYWDVCNPYNVLDPTNPAPVSISVNVVIITKPAALTTAGLAVCYTSPTAGQNFTAISGLGTRTAVNWYKDLASATAKAPKMTNSNGANSLTLPTSDYSVANAAIGAPFSTANPAGKYYSVWATQVTGATNSCESTPIEIVILQQPRIDIAPDLPSTPSGNASVCNGGAAEIYTTSTPAGTDKTIANNTVTNTTGSIYLPVENLWTHGFGAGVTMAPASGIGNSITMTYAIAAQPNPSTNANINVRRRYITTTNVPVVSKVTAPFTLPTYNINPLACQNANQSLNVVVAGISDGGTITGSPTICAGQSTGAMTLSGQRGTVIQWERNFNGGAFGAIAATAGLTSFTDLTLVTAGTYKYRVLIQNLASPGGPCSTATTIAANQNTVTVNPVPPKPSISASGPTTFCVGGSVTLTSSNTSAASYLWFKNGVSTGIVTQNIVLNTVAATGTYTVQTIGVAPSSCVSVLSDPVDVEIDPLPTVASATGGGPVCAGNPAPDIVFNLTGTPPYTISYTITLPPSPGGVGIVEPTNTFTIAAPTVGGTYKISSLVDANGCVATAIAPSRTVTIGGTPPTFVAPAPALSPTATCSNGASTTNPQLSFTLNAASASLTNFILTYKIDGGSNATKTFDTNASSQPTAAISFSEVALDAVGPHTVRIVSIQSSAGCLTVFNMDLAFTVNPLPAAPTGPVGNTYCSIPNTPGALSVANPGAGFTIDWYAAASGGVALATSTLTYTPTGGPGNYFAETRNTTTGCVSATRTAVASTLDTKPATASAGPAQPSVCSSAGTVTLAATAVGSGGVGSWSVNGKVAYYQNFTNFANGVTQSPAGNGWSINTSNANAFPQQGAPASSYFEVRSNRFEAENTNGNLGATVANQADLIWLSPIIDVSGIAAGNVAASVDYINVSGGLSGTDDAISIFYRLNGSAVDVAFTTNGSSSGNFTNGTASVTGLTASQLQIVVKVRNDGAADKIAFDNVIIREGTAAAAAISFANPNLNTTTVSGLPAPADGAAPITSTLTWTSASALGACPATTSTVAITINPAPLVLAAQSTSVCSGSAVNYEILLAPTPNFPAGSTFTWVDPDGGGGPATAKTNLAADPAGTKHITDILVNTSGATTFLDYQVQPKSALGCVGVTTAVRVNTLPAPKLNTPQTKTICSGQPVNYQILMTPANLPAGTTYSWPDPDGPAQPGTAKTIAADPAGTLHITDVLTNLTAAPITTTYVVTPTGPGPSNCVGTPQNVAITVNPLPTANPVSGSSSVCAGSTVLLYQVTPHAGSTYAWTVPAPFVKFGGGTPTDFFVLVQFPTVGSGNITMTETNSFPGLNCTGPVNSLAVTVANAPGALSINGPDPVCMNQIGVGYSVASPTPGSTYNWTASGATITSAASGPNLTTISVNFSLSTTATITVSEVSTSGCTGTPFTKNIAVSNIPTMTSSNSQSICSGGTPSLAFAASVPSNFSWEVTSITGAITAATAPVLAVGNTGTGNLGATFTGAQALINNSSAVGSVTFDVTPSTSAAPFCQGPTQSVVITVNPKPVIPAQTATVCSGAAFTVTPTDGNPTAATIVPTGTTYTWTAPVVSGGITGGSAQAVPVTSISQTLTNPTNGVQTATYTVTPTSGAAGTCPGSAFTVTVTVNPKPVIPAQTATICSGTSFTVTPANGVPAATTIVPAGTTYTWGAPIVTGGITGGSAQVVGQPNISQTLTNPTSIAQTATYTVTPTSGAAGACIGSTFNVTVTVNPTPAIPIQTTTVCSATAFIISPADGSPTAATIVPAGTTYTWTAPIVTGGLTGGSAQAAPQATISQTLSNPTSSPQTATYTVTPTSGAAGSCVGATFTVTVTVNPSPAIPAQAQTICSGGTFSLTPANGVPTAATVVPSGTTYTWTNPVVTGGVTGGSAQAVGQPLISQTLTNPTNTVQTATYTVAPTSGAAGACVGPNFTFVVTVNPMPVIPAQTSTICSGATFNVAPANGIPSAATIVPAATTYTWTAPVVTGGVTGGSAQAVGQPSISQTLTNPTNIVQTATYTVTPKSGAAGACVGANFTLTVTVNPKPVIANQTPSICSGSAFTVAPADGVPSAATIVPAGTTYTWAAPVVTGGVTGASAQGTPQPNISQTLTNPTNAVQTVTYTVTPTSGAAGACVGATFTVTVTVNPKPVIPAQSATICSGSTFTVTPADGVPAATTIVPAGTTYTWPAPVVSGGITGGSAQLTGAASISQTLTNPTSIVQTATYTVTPTSGAAGACVGATFTVNVTVNPKPVIANQTTSICSGTAFSISPTDGLPTAATIVPLGTTYAWGAPVVTGGITGGSAQAGQATIGQTLTNPTNTTQTATYTVTPTSGAAGSCVGATFTVTVTVNPAPAIPAQVATICSSGTFTVTPVNATPTAATVVPSGTTYTWLAPVVTGGVTGGSAQAVGQTSISQTLTNPTNAVQTATYTVTPTSGAAGTCVGATFTVTVTVNPMPVIPAQTAAICSGNAFTVSPTNGTPTAATIVPASTTYTWTAPVVTGGVTGGSAQAIAQPNISQTLTNPTNIVQTATYTVTPTSGAAGGCVGAAFTLTVTVNPKPVIANQTPSICSGSAFTISPADGVPSSATIVPSGTTYTWTAPVATGGVTGGSAQAAPQPNISQTLTNPTNAVQTVTYTVTPTSGASGGCVGATFTITVTVNPKPVIPAQSATICSGAAFSITPADGVPAATTIVPAGTTYTWPAPVVSGGVTGGTAQLTGVASIGQTLTNPTSVVQSATYTVTPTSGASGSCVGATFTVTVTVNPKPVIANQAVSICSGTAFSITPTDGLPTAATIVPLGTTYSWGAPVVTGGITGGSAQSGQTSISQMLTNPTNVNQTATYTVTPTSGAAGSCVGTPFTVAVVVNPVPVIPDQTTAICSGTAFTVAPTNGTPTAATVVPSGTTYTWTNPVVTGGVTGASAQASGQTSISQTLTNPTNAAQTVTYTVTPTSGAGGSCVGATFQIVVTVNPVPAIPAQVATVCSGTAFTVTPSNGVPTASTIVPGGTTYTWAAPVVTGGLTGGSAQAVGQPNISQTLTNPTNSSQVATYAVTPTSGSCVGAPFNVIVTVSPKPAIPAQSASICSGTSFTIAPVDGVPSTATIVPGGTTYTWTAPVVTGGVTGSSAQPVPQPSISQTLTNPTNTVQTVTYTVTPTSGSCTGSTFTIIVNVNPKPFVPDQTPTICSGTAFTVNPANGVPTAATIVPASTTYSWPVPVVTGGVTGATAQSNQSSISQTLNNPTNTPQTATYTVTPTSGASGTCVGATFTITVTVNPKPSIPAQAPVVCSGTAFTVNPVDGIPTAATVVPAGTTYTWAAPSVTGGITGGSAQAVGVASISQTLTNPTNIVQTATYTVTPTSGAAGSCVGSPFTISVTVNPKPVIPAQTATICSGALFTVTPSNGVPTAATIVPSGTTYTWTVPAVTGGVTGGSAQLTGVASISQTLTNPTNSPQTATYTVTPTSGAAGSCAGATFTVTVTINPQPVIPNQTTAICSGTAFTVNPANGVPTSATIVPSSTTYTWLAPVVTGGVLGGSAQAAGQPTISQTLTNPTNTPQTATYTVTPTSGAAGSCVGANFTITVTVNPRPAIPNQTPAICSGSAFTVSPSDGLPTAATIVPAGTTYTWPAPAVTGGVTGSSAQLTGVTSISQTLTNPTNAVQTVTYTVTPTSGAAGACVGGTFTVTVTVNPQPVIPNQTATICSGNPFTINPVNGSPTAATIVPSGTTYSWAVPIVTGGVTGGSAQSGQSSISQTLTNPTNSVQTATYTVIPTSGTSGSCVGASFTITVTVNPKPVIPAQTTAICSGAAFSITPIDGLPSSATIVPTGTTYTWTAPVVTGGVTGASAQAVGVASIGQTLTNPTNSVQTVTYTVTPTSGAAGACVGATFTVTVTVNPKPVIANQTPTICSGTAFSVSPTNGVPTAATIVPTNTTYTWPAPVVTGGVTGASAQTSQTSISQTLVNPTNTVQTVTYTVTPTSGAAGACVGAPFTIVVSVNPVPAIAAQTATICSGNAFNVAPINGNPSAATIVPAGTTYAWAVPIVTGGLTGGSAQTGQTSISQTLTNPTNSVQSATYTVTPTSGAAGSCVGSVFTVTVTVNPKPIIPDQAQTICSGTAFTISPTDGVPSSATIVPASTKYTWTAPVVTGGMTGATAQGVPQNSVSQVLTNPTNVAQTATYTVTPISGAAGSCVGPTFQVVVTVNPVPVGQAISSIERCSGAAINFNLQDIINNVAPFTGGNSVSAIFAYTVVADFPLDLAPAVFPGTFDRVTASAANITNSFTNVSNHDVTLSYTVTPYSVIGNCAGSPFTFNVVYHPEPVGSNFVQTGCSSTLNFNIQTKITNGLPSVFTYVVTSSDEVNVPTPAALDRVVASNAPITDTFTNPTSSVVTVTYTITPYNSAHPSCAGVPFTYKVDIGSMPIASSDTKVAVCSDVPFLIDPQGNITNGVISTFSWVPSYDPGLTGGPVGTQTGVISMTLTNTSNVQKNATFTITPSAGPCAGSPFTIIKPVNPEPVMDPTLATKTICSTNPTSSNKVNITLATNGVSVPAANYNITLKSQDAGLTGTPTTGVGLSSTAILNDTYNNVTAVALNVVYTIVPVAAGGCLGDPFDITVTVNPEPVISASLNNTVCSTDISNIILSTDGVSVGAASYRLVNVTVPGGLTANPGNTAVGTVTGINMIKNDSYSNGTNGALTVIYDIRATSPSGCEGASRLINLTVSPAPVLDPTLNPTPVCSGVNSGVTLGVAVGSVAAATYNINSILFPGLIAGGSNTGIGTGKASNAMFNDVYINTTSAPLTATYKIAAVSALGCIGPLGTVTLTINPSPDLDNGIGRTVCSTNASGITFATTPSSAVASTYNLISVTIAPGLTAGGGNVAPANGRPANYIAADTYTNPTNGTLTVTYRVEPVSAAGCKGPQEDVILIVEPAILAAPINHKPTICSNSGPSPTATDVELLSPTVPSAGTITFNYTAVSSIGAQITGFVPALTNLAAGYRIQDALVNNSNASAFVTYTITPVAAGAKSGSGCTGTPVAVVVNVEPRPKLIPSPLTKTVCEGTPIGIALTTTTVPSAGTVEYLLVSRVATGGVTGMSAAGTVFAATSTLNDNLSSPSTTTENVTYTFRPRINGGAGCIGDDVLISVNVNPRPNISATGVPAAICSGDQVNISIVSDVSSTVSTWPAPTIAPTAGSVTGGSAGAGDQLFQILFNKTSPVVQTVTYTVTPSASGCAGTPLTINVPVNPVPDVLGTATTTICSGGTLNVPLSSKVTSGVNFTWTVDDPSGLGVPTSGSGTTINQMVTNTTGSQASLTYTITPILTAPGTTSGTCTGDSKIMFVTVAPALSAAFLNSPSPDFICAGSTEYLVFQFGGQPPFDFTYTKQGPTGPAVPFTLNNKGPVVVVQDVLSAAGAYTYTITSVTSHVNSVSCTTPFNVPFVVNVGDTDPNFNIISPLATCSPNTVSFQYNQVAGTIYTWRFGDAADSLYTATTTVPNKVIKHIYTNLSPTSTLSYPVSMQTELPPPYPGCFKSIAPKTISIYPKIIANIIADKTTICSGETIRFSNQSVGATSQAWSYRVQGQIPETSLGTSLNMSNAFTNNTTSNPIVYEVIYRGTNGNCPTPDQIIPIQVYRLAAASFDEGTVPPFVNGQSIVNFTNTSSILDNAQFSYDWTFGSDSQPNSYSGLTPPAIKYVRPGPKNVTLTVINRTNPFCKIIFEKQININLLPLVATFKASPAESCFPAKIVVTESNITGDVIEWRVFDANGRTAATSSAVLPTFNIPSEGKYTITLKTSSSLTGQVAVAQNQTVTVYAKPFASFDARPDVLYVPDTELTTFNFSTGANQYSWDFGDGGKSVDEEPKYVYKIEGIYDITLIAMFDHGNKIVCADTLKHQVVAKQGGVTKVPNAFTPNPAGPSGGVAGSGSFNDVFLPIVKGAEEYNLQIFDRWGNLIFESNSTQIGWDGYNASGILLPAGVYVYKLTIRLSDGQRSTQIGDVTMIR